MCYAYCTVNAFVLWKSFAFVHIIVHLSFIQIFSDYIHSSGHIFSGFGMSLWHLSPYSAFDGSCKDNFLFKKKFFIYSLFSIILFIQHNPFMHLKTRKFWKKFKFAMEIEGIQKRTRRHTWNSVEHFSFDVH